VHEVLPKLDELLFSSVEGAFGGVERVRQDAVTAALRLFLRGDRRHDLLGHANPQPPRRVDTTGRFRPAQATRALESYDGIAGLVLDRIAIDGAITNAPGGGEVAGRSSVDRGEQGLKRSGMTDGYGIPLGSVLAAANRHDSPPLAPTLDRPESLSPLPDTITVHLDTGYESDSTGALLSERGLHGRIAHMGEKVPIQASRRWHVERTHAWQNAFHRLARCHERRVTGIDAFFDLADATITVRSLIRRSWTTHSWGGRPSRRP
jgi:hypothetical protein